MVLRGKHKDAAARVGNTWAKDAAARVGNTWAKDTAARVGNTWAKDTAARLLINSQLLHTYPSYYFSKDKYLFCCCR